MGRMAEDEAGAPLSRRVPGAARPGPGQSAKPVLSDSTLNRMQAAIEAERAQAEPEHLTTVPRYEDDPNTEPLPAVTSASPGRRGKRGRNPSGTGADPGVPPEPARKLGAVAETPPDEGPLRVARALRAAGPEPVPAGGPEPVPAAGPEPVPAAGPEPVHAAGPPPVRAVEPPPVFAAGPPPVRAVEPPPVRAVEPPPVRAVEPPPASSLPPLGGHPAESMQPTRAADDGPWWASTPASEPGPTPGTIGWLWPEDTTTRGGGGGGQRWRPPRRWGYRAVTLVTLAAGVLVGAGLFVGIALHSTPVAGGAHGKSTPKATSAPTPSADPMPSASSSAGGNAGGLAASLSQAAAWVNAQVGSGSNTLVACDNQTCAALTAAGFPVAQQVAVQTDPQSVTSANIVVVDPTVRSYMNSHPGLANYVTPTVLASFGQVTVQVVYPEGVAAYQAALNADVQARIQLGQQLLDSGQLTASPAAEADLENGDVDPRLLLALQSLADSEPIDVLAFEDAGPVPSAGAPYRAIELAVSDSASGLSQSAYVQWLEQTVTAEATFPSYLKAGPVTLPDGQTAGGIEYGAPTPLGLLSSS
jgi:hypothetical protein